MIHLWIQERSKESRVELGEQATNLIRRSWNTVWRSSNFEQKRSFSRRVIPHLNAVVEHFNRKPVISEATSTAPEISEIASAGFSAGMIDTVCAYIQRLRSTWRLRSVANDIRPISFHRHDYPLPWWQSMHLLGDIYTSQGLYKKAEALYRATLAEVWSTLPKEHLHAIEIVEDLSWSISKQNRFDESLQWYSWALNSRAKSFGGMNAERKNQELLSWLLHVYAMMADSFYRDGRANDALEWNARAYYLQDELPKHEVRAYNAARDKVLVGMGESFANLERWDEAALTWQVLLPWREFAFGIEHERTRTILHRLALARFKSARYDEALTHWRRLLVDSIRALNDDHLDVLNTLVHLGRVHLELKQYDEALHLLTAALEGKKRHLNHDRPIVLDATRDISLLYWRQKNYEKAFDWIQTAVSTDIDDHLRCLNLLKEFRSITIHNLGRNVEELRLLCERNSRPKADQD